MLEKIITSILTSYLGSYFENIDAEEVKVSLWNGEITLHQLRMRTDALRFLDTPFCIREGIIAELTVQIPWTRLTSESVNITIQHVKLIIMDKSNAKYDVLQSIAEALRRKKYQLDLFEEQIMTEFRSKLSHLEENNQSIEKVSSDEGESGNETFRARIQASVLNNIKIKVKHIQIEYLNNSNNCSNDSHILQNYTKKSQISKSEETSHNVVNKAANITTPFSSSSTSSSLFASTLSTTSSEELESKRQMADNVEKVESIQKNQVNMAENVCNSGILLRISQMETFACDETYTEAFNSANVSVAARSILYKRFEFTGVTVFVFHTAASSPEKSVKTKASIKMRKNSSLNRSRLHLQEIISPFDMVILAQYQPILRHFTLPQYTLGLRVSSFDIKCDELQWKVLTNIIDQLLTAREREEVREEISLELQRYRPSANVRVHDNPRAWWRYAIIRVTNELRRYNRQRANSSLFFKRAEHAVKECKADYFSTSSEQTTKLNVSDKREITLSGEEENRNKSFYMEPFAHKLRPFSWKDYVVLRDKRNDYTRLHMRERRTELHATAWLDELTLPELSRYETLETELPLEVLQWGRRNAIALVQHERVQYEHIMESRIKERTNVQSKNDNLQEIKADSTSKTDSNTTTNTKIKSNDLAGNVKVDDTNKDDGADNDNSKRLQASNEKMLTIPAISAPPSSSWISRWYDKITEKFDANKTTKGNNVSNFVNSNNTTTASPDSNNGNHDNLTVEERTEMKRLIETLGSETWNAAQRLAISKEIGLTEEEVAELEHESVAPVCVPVEDTKSSLVYWKCALELPVFTIKFIQHSSEGDCLPVVLLYLQGVSCITTQEYNVPTIAVQHTRKGKHENVNNIIDSNEEQHWQCLLRVKDYGIQQHLYPDANPFVLRVNLSPSNTTHSHSQENVKESNQVIVSQTSVLLPSEQIKLLTLRQLMQTTLIYSFPHFALHTLEQHFYNDEQERSALLLYYRTKSITTQSSNNNNKNCKNSNNNTKNLFSAITAHTNIEENKTLKKENETNRVNAETDGKGNQGTNNKNIECPNCNERNSLIVYMEPVSLTIPLYYNVDDGVMHFIVRACAQYYNSRYRFKDNNNNKDKKSMLTVQKTNRTTKHSLMHNAKQNELIDVDHAARCESSLCWSVHISHISLLIPLAFVSRAISTHNKTESNINNNDNKVIVPRTKAENENASSNLISQELSCNFDHFRVYGKQDATAPTTTNNDNTDTTPSNFSVEWRLCEVSVRKSYSAGGNDNNNSSNNDITVDKQNANSHQHNDKETVNEHLFSLPSSRLSLTQKQKDLSRRRTNLNETDNMYSNQNKESHWTISFSEIHTQSENDIMNSANEQLLHNEQELISSLNITCSRDRLTLINACYTRITNYVQFLKYQWETALTSDLVSQSTLAEYQKQRYICQTNNFKTATTVNNDEKYVFYAHVDVCSCEDVSLHKNLPISNNICRVVITNRYNSNDKSSTNSNERGNGRSIVIYHNERINEPLLYIDLIDNHYHVTKRHDSNEDVNHSSSSSGDIVYLFVENGGIAHSHHLQEEEENDRVNPNDHNNINNTTTTTAINDNDDSKAIRSESTQILKETLGLSHLPDNIAHVQLLVREWIEMKEKSIKENASSSSSIVTPSFVNSSAQSEETKSASTKKKSTEVKKESANEGYERERERVERALAILSQHAHVCPCACIRFMFVTSININETTANNVVGSSSGTVGDAGANTMDSNVQIRDADKFMEMLNEIKIDDSNQEEKEVETQTQNEKQSTVFDIEFAYKTMQLKMIDDRSDRHEIKEDVLSANTSTNEYTLTLQPCKWNFRHYDQTWEISSSFALLWLTANNSNNDEATKNLRESSELSLHAEHNTTTTLFAISNESIQPNKGRFNNNDTTKETYSTLNFTIVQRAEPFLPSMKAVVINLVQSVHVELTSSLITALQLIWDEMFILIYRPNVCQHIECVPWHMLDENAKVESNYNDKSINLLTWNKMYEESVIQHNASHEEEWRNDVHRGGLPVFTVELQTNNLHINAHLPEQTYPVMKLSTEATKLMWKDAISSSHVSIHMTAPKCLLRDVQEEQSRLYGEEAFSSIMETLQENKADSQRSTETNMSSNDNESENVMNDSGYCNLQFTLLKRPPFISTNEYYNTHSTSFEGNMNTNKIEKQNETVVVKSRNTNVLDAFSGYRYNSSLEMTFHKVHLALTLPSLLFAIQFASRGLSAELMQLAQRDVFGDYIQHQQIVELPHLTLPWPWTTMAPAAASSMPTLQRESMYLLMHKVIKINNCPLWLPQELNKFSFYLPEYGKHSDNNGSSHTETDTLTTEVAELVLENSIHMFDKSTNVEEIIFTRANLYKAKYANWQIESKADQEMKSVSDKESMNNNNTNCMTEAMNLSFAITQPLWNAQLHEWLQQDSKIEEEELWQIRKKQIDQWRQAHQKFSLHFYPLRLQTTMSEAFDLTALFSANFLNTNKNKSQINDINNTENMKNVSYKHDEHNPEDHQPPNRLYEKWITCLETRQDRELTKRMTSSLHDTHIEWNVLVDHCEWALLVSSETPHSGFVQCNSRKYIQYHLTNAHLTWEATKNFVNYQENSRNNNSVGSDNVNTNVNAEVQPILVHHYDTKINFICAGASIGLAQVNYLMNNHVTDRINKSGTSNSSTTTTTSYSLHDDNTLLLSSSSKSFRPLLQIGEAVDSSETGLDISNTRGDNNDNNKENVVVVTFNKSSDIYTHPDKSPRSRVVDYENNLSLKEVEEIDAQINSQVEFYVDSSVLGCVITVLANLISELQERQETIMESASMTNDENVQQIENNAITKDSRVNVQANKKKSKRVKKILSSLERQLVIDCDMTLQTDLYLSTHRNTLLVQPKNVKCNHITLNGAGHSIYVDVEHAPSNNASTAFTNALIVLDDHITLYIVNAVFCEWHHSAEHNISKNKNSSVVDKRNMVESNTTNLSSTPVEGSHAAIMTLLQKCVQAGQYSYIVLGNEVTYKEFASTVNRSLQEPTTATAKPITITAEADRVCDRVDEHTELDLLESYFTQTDNSNNKTSTQVTVNYVPTHKMNSMCFVSHDLQRFIVAKCAKLQIILVESMQSYNSNSITKSNKSVGCLANASSSHSTSQNFVLEARIGGVINETKRVSSNSNNFDRFNYHVDCGDVSVYTKLGHGSNNANSVMNECIAPCNVSLSGERDGWHAMTHECVCQSEIHIQLCYSHIHFMLNSLTELYSTLLTHWTLLNDTWQQSSAVEDVWTKMKDEHNKLYVNMENTNVNDDNSNTNISIGEMSKSQLTFQSPFVSVTLINDQNGFGANMEPLFRFNLHQIRMNQQSSTLVLSECTSTFTFILEMLHYRQEEEENTNMELVNVTNSTNNNNAGNYNSGGVGEERKDETRNEWELLMDALPCTIVCKESKHLGNITNPSLIYYDVRIGSVKMYITPLLIQNIAILYTLQSDLMSTFARQSRTLNNTSRATKSVKIAKVKNKVTNSINLQGNTDKKKNNYNDSSSMKNTKLHATSHTSHNTSHKEFVLEQYLRATAHVSLLQHHRSNADSELLSTHNNTNNKNTLATDNENENLNKVYSRSKIGYGEVYSFDLPRPFYKSYASPLLSSMASTNTQTKLSTFYNRDNDNKDKSSLQPIDDRVIEVKVNEVEFSEIHNMVQEEKAIHDSKDDNNLIANRQQCTIDDFTIKLSGKCGKYVLLPEVYNDSSFFSDYAMVIEIEEALRYHSLQRLQRSVTLRTNITLYNDLPFALKLNGLSIMSNNSISSNVLNVIGVNIHVDDNATVDSSKNVNPPFVILRPKEVMHAPIEFFRNRVSFTPMLAVQSSSLNVGKDINHVESNNDRNVDSNGITVNDSYTSCALGCCYGDLPSLQGCSFLCVSPRVGEKVNDKTDTLYFFTRCMSAGQYVNLNHKNYHNTTTSTSSYSRSYERYSDVILSFHAPLHLVNACGAPVHVSLFTRTDKVTSVKHNVNFKATSSTINSSSSSSNLFSTTYSYNYLTSFNMNVIDQCNHRRTHHANNSMDSANDSSNVDSDHKHLFCPLPSSSSASASSSLYEEEEQHSSLSWSEQEEEQIHTKPWLSSSVHEIIAGADPVQSLYAQFSLYQPNGSVLQTSPEEYMCIYVAPGEKPNITRSSSIMLQEFLIDNDEYSDNSAISINNNNTSSKSNTSPSSKLGSKLHLQLHYRNDNRDVILYCPVWITNTTNYALQIAEGLKTPLGFNNNNNSTNNTRVTASSRPYYRLIAGLKQAKGSATSNTAASSHTTRQGKLPAENVLEQVRFEKSIDACGTASESAMQCAPFLFSSSYFNSKNDNHFLRELNLVVRVKEQTTQQWSRFSAPTKMFFDPFEEQNLSSSAPQEAQNTQGNTIMNDNNSTTWLQLLHCPFANREGNSKPSRTSHVIIAHLHYRVEKVCVYSGVHSLYTHVLHLEPFCVIENHTPFYLELCQLIPVLVKRENVIHNNKYDKGNTTEETIVEWRRDLGSISQIQSKNSSNIEADSDMYDETSYLSSSRSYEGQIVMTNITWRNRRNIYLQLRCNALSLSSESLRSFLIAPSTSSASSNALLQSSETSDTDNDEELDELDDDNDDNVSKEVVHDAKSNKIEFFSTEWSAPFNIFAVLEDELQNAQNKRQSESKGSNNSNTNNEESLSEEQMLMQHFQRHLVLVKYVQLVPLKTYWPHMNTLEPKMNESNSEQSTILKPTEVTNASSLPELSPEMILEKDKELYVKVPVERLLEVHCSSVHSNGQVKMRISAIDAFPYIVENRSNCTLYIQPLQNTNSNNNSSNSTPFVIRPNSSAGYMFNMESTLNENEERDCSASGVVLNMQAEQSLNSAYIDNNNNNSNKQETTKVTSSSSSQLPQNLFSQVITLHLQPFQLVKRTQTSQQVLMFAAPRSSNTNSTNKKNSSQSSQSSLPEKISENNSSFVERLYVYTRCDNTHAHSAQEHEYLPLYPSEQIEYEEYNNNNGVMSYQNRTNAQQQYKKKKNRLHHSYSLYIIISPEPVTTMLTFAPNSKEQLLQRRQRHVQLHGRMDALYCLCSSYQSYYGTRLVRHITRRVRQPHKPLKANNEATYSDYVLIACKEIEVDAEEKWEVQQVGTEEQNRAIQQTITNTNANHGRLIRRIKVKLKDIQIDNEMYAEQTQANNIRGGNSISNNNIKPFILRMSANKTCQLLCVLECSDVTSAIHIAEFALGTCDLFIHLQDSILYALMNYYAELKSRWVDTVVAYSSSNNNSSSNTSINSHVKSRNSKTLRAVQKNIRRRKEQNTMYSYLRHSMQSLNSIDSSIVIDKFWIASLNVEISFYHERKAAYDAMWNRINQLSRSSFVSLIRNCKELPLHWDFVRELNVCFSSWQGLLEHYKMKYSMALRQQTGSIMLAAGADVVKSFVQNLIPNAANVVTELAMGNIGINDNRNTNLIRSSNSNLYGAHFSANRRAAAFARDKIMMKAKSNDKKEIQSYESNTLTLSKPSLLSVAAPNLETSNYYYNNNTIVQRVRTTTQEQNRKNNVFVVMENNVPRVISDKGGNATSRLTIEDAANTLPWSSFVELVNDVAELKRYGEIAIRHALRSNAVVMPEITASTLQYKRNSYSKINNNIMISSKSFLIATSTNNTSYNNSNTTTNTTQMEHTAGLCTRCKEVEQLRLQWLQRNCNQQHQYNSLTSETEHVWRASPLPHPDTNVITWGEFLHHMSWTEFIMACSDDEIDLWASVMHDAILGQSRNVLRWNV